MKILLATYWHVPHLGGVWSYMNQMRDKLQAEGHEVDLLGYGDEAGSYVHIVNKNQRLQTNKLLPLIQTMLNAKDYPAIHDNDLVRFTEFRRYAFELAVAYFGLESYDVINTQDVISTACINRVRPRKPALVATLHGSVAHEVRLQLKTIHKSPNSQLARKYYDRLERTGASAAEYTVVANEWLRNVLTSEFHVPEHKIKVFHYGYDIDSFYKRSKMKTDIVRPKNKKVILYAGRLVELKGVQHLLDALGKLKDKRENWVCWIAGEGDMSAELRLQTKVLGLEEKVVFLGKRDDIPSLLAHAHIFVLPSIIENQPLSVIEAQLAGLAIIASNTGGLPEMIKDKVTGLLAPVGDSQQLYKYMKELLDDDRYRKNLGAEAKQWAIAHWSLDLAATRILEVYQSALSERRSAADDRYEENLGKD
ncbi:MAG: glycosyltransferase family 4 protein [Cohnella sp.]|nr:glycosyltransferase family 4 protein [Cohnella sp.]